MALDGFVKIDGIEGESTDDNHVGWIEIIRYGIGIKQTIYTAASSVGGVCIGRADFSGQSTLRQPIGNCWLGLLHPFPMLPVKVSMTSLILKLISI